MNTASPTAPPDPLRVFVIEDSPHIREILIDYLQVPGQVEIVGFSDSETDALQKLSTCAADAAIVDLKLREGTGMGVLKRLRESHAPKLPKLIVFTNHPFPELRLHCLQLGADYFFDKSADYEALRNTIHALHASKVAGTSH